MADQEQINQIAAQLQPKYASYLRDPSKKGNLSAAERRVLDAVRSNPSPGQLESLYQFTKSSTDDFMVRERAFGFLATALGMPAQESRSLWQRLNRMTPLTGPGGRAPAEPAPPPQVSSQRVPGEGSARGGELKLFGVSVARTRFLDAILPLMNEPFQNLYRGGAGVGLSIEDQQAILNALRNPNNPDLGVLQRYARIPASSFSQAVTEATKDIQVGRIEAGQQATAASTAAAERLNAYYDPSTSSVVFMTRAQAQQRGFVPATSAQQSQQDRKAASGQAAPAGFEYQYDPLQSKPVLVPVGTTLPSRAPGAPTRRETDTQDVVTEDVGGDGVIPGGVAPGATGGEMAADTGVPPDWEAAAAEMYPQYYAVVKNIPEIADLLRRSLGPPAWSEAKFDAELRKTNWYQTTSASAREWDLKSAQDPATYQAMVDEQAANLSTQALNFGIRLSDETVQKLALDSLRWGMGDQQIINSIGMAATAGGTAGATQLREGYYGQSVRRIARQYGVTLSDQTFNSFVNRIAVGDETMDSFQDYALNIAKSLYPSVAAQFDAGRTFDDITDPFRQIAASTLELNPEEIDFTDPKWVTPITYQPDPKTGEQRLMTLTEWTKELRTNRAYGYEFTNQARNQAYSVVETLGNLFGRI